MSREAVHATWVEIAGLKIARELHNFIRDEALRARASATRPLASFSSIVRDLAPRNCELLAIRDDIQQKLDDILSVPVARRPNWTPDEIQRELDNN
ncbi:hypothetical protein NKJ56_30435, partial [Mesorhizobium sp. M0093]